MRHDQKAAAAADLAELLLTYAMVQIGGHVRLARWVPRTLYPGDQVYELQLLRLEAFRAKLTGGTYTIKAEDGERHIPLAKVVLSRARQYDGLVFLPGADDVVNNKLNLWRDFGVTPAEGRWQLMEEHLREVIAGGDQASFDYIHRWLAWSVQHPGERAEVALVVRGGKGVGKGTLGNAMCRIFGTHGVHVSDRKHLTAGFNRHLMHCSLLFADEAYWPGDKQGEGALKRLVSEPTLFIEPKGLDGFEVANCLHVIIAGNDNWVVPASSDERRYAVFEVPDMTPRAEGYFADLHAELDQGGLAAMLYDLLHVDLGDWHPRRNIPQTRALIDQKSESLAGIDALIAILVRDGILPYPMPGRPDVCVTSGEDRGEGLWAYAKRAVPTLHHSTAHHMASRLKKDWGCTHTEGNNPRGMQFPPLAALRARFCKRYCQPNEWGTETWGQ